MGSFVEVTNEGIKTYTLFSKGSIKKVLELQAILPEYSFNPESRSICKEMFLDSPKNLLSSAGILLSRVTENNKAFFKVEREAYFAGRTQRSKLPQRAEKVFIHNIGIRDRVNDHMFFLTDGIKSMFSTQFYIDLDNVLKTVVPKIEINSKKTVYKIFSGKGFKAEMIFDEVSLKNYESKRSGNLTMLTVKQTSSKLNLSEFEDFTAKLEKYCKEIIPTDDTKYQIAKRMTK